METQNETPNETPNEILNNNIENSELLFYIESIVKIEDLKLGGKISKSLVKTKKILIKTYGIIEDTRKMLCKQYADKDEQGQPKLIFNVQTNEEEFIFSKENRIQVDKEFNIILKEKVDFSIEKPCTEAIIDQFKDITPKQTEAILLFSE